jgi:hypothetical protein
MTNDVSGCNLILVVTTLAFVVSFISIIFIMSERVAKKCCRNISRDIFLKRAIFSYIASGRNFRFVSDIHDENTVMGLHDTSIVRSQLRVVCVVRVLTLIAFVISIGVVEKVFCQ